MLFSTSTASEVGDIANISEDVRQRANIARRLSEYYNWVFDQKMAKMKIKALPKNSNVWGIYDHFNKRDLPLGHRRAEKILRYCKIEVPLLCYPDLSYRVHEN